MADPLEDLSRALSRLPGLGRRSSLRAALAILREPERVADPIAAALARARETMCCCARCGAFTLKTANPCALCTDTVRDGSAVCVVEEPADIQSIESSGAFRGRYHALMGKLSPVNRSGPEKLRIAELLDRVRNEGFKEVVLALSTDMEGDATAAFLAENLKQFPEVKVTRLAFGLPADSGIAYSDPLTLRRAIAARLDVGG